MNKGIIACNMPLHIKERIIVILDVVRNRAFPPNISENMRCATNKLMVELIKELISEELGMLGIRMPSVLMAYAGIIFPRPTTETDEYLMIADLVKLLDMEYDDYITSLFDEHTKRWYEINDSVLNVTIDKKIKIAEIELQSAKNRADAVRKGISYSAHVKLIESQQAVKKAKALGIVKTPHRLVLTGKPHYINPLK